MAVLPESSPGSPFGPTILFLKPFLESVKTLTTESVNTSFSSNNFPTLDTKASLLDIFSFKESPNFPGDCAI